MYNPKAAYKIKTLIKIPRSAEDIIRYNECSRVKKSRQSDATNKTIVGIYITEPFERTTAVESIAPMAAALAPFINDWK